VRTAQLCREFDLQVRYTVFPLHTETPDEGVSLEEMFAGRLDVPAMLRRLSQVAESLELPFSERRHTYNSRRAQELGKWAEHQGQGEAFQDATYRAYFAEGKNIAQRGVLTEIAGTIGLDTSEADRVLQEGRYADQVDADWERAQANGVTAVPTLTYGDRSLVGFQSYENFRKLISD